MPAFPLVWPLKRLPSLVQVPDQRLESQGTVRFMASLQELVTIWLNARGARSQGEALRWHPLPVLAMPACQKLLWVQALTHGVVWAMSRTAFRSIVLAGRVQRRARCPVINAVIIHRTLVKSCSCPSE